VYVYSLQCRVYSLAAAFPGFPYSFALFPVFPYKAPVGDKEERDKEEAEREREVAGRRPVGEGD
jgi:hypothetical protein